MNVAHEKLHGLDRDRILAVVEPILRAHHVEGVELLWRTDRGGWVLELTVERPNARLPGEGITVDLCSEISRDLSAALDVADVIPQRYRLEVGSPGLERALYLPKDYVRFAGQNAKLKLREPIDGQKVIRGTLHGLDDSERIIIEIERGELAIELGNIDSAQLLFDWRGAGSADQKNARGSVTGRGRKAPRPQRGR